MQQIDRFPLFIYLIIYLIFSAPFVHAEAENPVDKDRSEVNIYVKDKAVEKNRNGGFRPKWILVDENGEAIPDGVLVHVIETRTMKHNPDIVIKRYFTGTVVENGRLTYDWHWNSANHQKLALYKWHIESSPDSGHKYEGDGDSLFIPYKNLPE